MLRYQIRQKKLRQKRSGLFHKDVLMIWRGSLHLSIFKVGFAMKRIFARPLENLSIYREFNKCSTFRIIAVENKVITEMLELSASSADPINLPECLRSYGVTDVLATDIDITMIQQLASSNINTFLGVQAGDPLVRMQQFIDNRLTILGYGCNQRAHHFFGQY